MSTSSTHLHLHGLGYAMGHFIDGKFKVVAWGSKSLTSTQLRYATIELKCLAVHFAVDKCLFYLKGAPSFMVVTHFDPNLPVTVLTDGSRLHGLGYAIIIIYAFLEIMAYLPMPSYNLGGGVWI